MADVATPLPTSDEDEGANADAPETRRATVTIEMFIILRSRRIGGLRLQCSRALGMTHLNDDSTQQKRVKIAAIIAIVFIITIILASKATGLSRSWLPNHHRCMYFSTIHYVDENRRRIKKCRRNNALVP
jgi:hypothetical protein